MKRHVSISLILVVVLVPGRFCVQSLANEQGAGAGGIPSTWCRASCGDLNGDEGADLSDAVYLLSHLFLGGPEPVCKDPPELTERMQELEAAVAAQTELEGELAAARAELAACNSELAAAEAELAVCRTDLESAETQLASCSTDLESMEAIAAARATRIQELVSQLNVCRKPLPDTGQTICRDDGANEIACDTAPCPGQDGLYSTGCPTEDRFVDNGDDTVTDTCTGLMWQRQTADVDGNGTFADVDNGDKVTWCQALAYCEDLVFAGHSDWRLPNVRELESIFYYGSYDLFVDPVFHISRHAHWSSTSSASDPYAAWFGIIRNGIQSDPLVKNRAHRVLAVRTEGSSVSPGGSLPDTGQTTCHLVGGAEIACDSDTCPGQDGFYSTGCPSEGRFVDNWDGTVTDTCTGLMWQSETADTNADGTGNESDVLQWCDALVFCEGLTFAGHGDWRLPNARELHSIVDFGRANPAVDPVFRLSSQLYWSSTDFSSSPRAIVADFNSGGSNFVGRSDSCGVLAVRTIP